MTIEQIIENANKRTDRRGESKLDLKTELLGVLQQFCQEHRWFWRRKSAYFDTVANTTEYSLKDSSGNTVTDFEQATESPLMVFSGGSLISRIHPEFDIEEQEKMRQSTESNIPSKYFVSGTGTFIVSPIPNGAYRVRVPYWAVPGLTPDELTGDVPLVPPQLHHILEKGLEAEIYRWMDGEGSSRFRDAIALYDRWVEKSAGKENFALGRHEEWRTQNSNDAVQST